MYAGLEDESRVRLRVFRRAGDGSLVGRVWFGQGTDGPPGHVHGGASAYILDEAMGSAGWMNELPVVAAKLEFEYLRMVPLEVDLHIEASVKKTAGKRVEILSKLMLPTGEVCVTGRGTFAILAKSQFAAVAKGGADDVLSNPSIKWSSGDEG